MFNVLLFPPLCIKELPSRQADFQEVQRKKKGIIILKGNTLALLGRLSEGSVENGKYFNYLCSCLLAIFDYEKACFILKKREHKIASLNFASENILLAPIKALQLLISAA